jgi:hypothetical protein
MDKSSRNSVPSKLEKPKIEYDKEAISLGMIDVDSESKIAYNQSTNPATVAIQSVLGARLEYTGQVSGKQYVWNKAGDIVLVDAEDSEILLAKRIGGRLCCGNSQDINKIFQIAH